MNGPNFNLWPVNDLKEFLLQHNIDDFDIPKSGQSKTKPLKSVAQQLSFNPPILESFPYYSQLPQDVMFEVMKHLDVKELLHLCQTSHHPFCFDQALWSSLYLDHFYFRFEHSRNNARRVENFWLCVTIKAAFSG